MDASIVHGVTPATAKTIKLHDIEPNVVMFTAEQPYAEAGAFNVQNGITTFSDHSTDSDEIVMMAANASYAATLLEKGYQQDDSLVVEIGAGETSFERESIWPQLLLDQAVQASKLKNRTAEYTDADGHTQEFITENPFDTSDYIELTRYTVESRPDGVVAGYEDFLGEQLHDPEFLKSVGKYNYHNGVLTWTTASDGVQLAPLGDARIERLEAMGYVRDETISVPHSNGEQWLDNDEQPQIYDVVTGKAIGTAAEIWTRLK